MKRNAAVFILLGLALSLVPSIVFGFEFSWSSPDEDKSLFYLGQIFGPVGSALPHGTGNALISQLFSVFNIAVLTLGSIVVSYTIVLSTINTAQEGEVMGKKWSSLWIPLRSAVGMAFLLPTASGYSLLQIMMMEVVVYGVAAANQVWAQVVYAFSGSGTGLLGTVEMTDSNPAGYSPSLATAANKLLESAVCTYVVNNTPECRASMGSNTVSAYQPLNTTDRLAFGVENTANATVCGSISAGTAPSLAQDVSSWNASNVMAFNMAYNNLGSAASEIAIGQTPSSSSVIYTASSVILNNLASTPQARPSLASENEKALKNGWIFAGSYYFVMISNGNNKVKYPPPTATGAPTGGSLTSACLNKITVAKSNMTSYLALSDPSGGGEGNNQGSLSLPSVETDENVAQFLDAITGPLRGAVQDFMLHLTTNDPRGPVASLAGIGEDLLAVAENIWFGMMIASLVAMLIACIMSGMQPACMAVGSIITVLVPILMAVIMILWVAGGMIGIYLPLVPYLVFTFTALGWVLLVIETIVAAPIVALGLVSPSGEHLGKAAPAVQLVANVFLRPSLMVIGFATAAKLAEAMIGMLNYGFFATVDASVHGIGVFGCIALLTLYAGVAVAIIHECFSLIHVLPDKIMRWIGGQAEQSQVKQLMQEAKKSAEKGHEIGGELMKGSAGMVTALGKKAKGKGKKKGKGKGEG